MGLCRVVREQLALAYHLRTDGPKLETLSRLENSILNPQPDVPQTDVERAFKREWHAMPEVAKSAKNSNKSRIKSSLTFAGSLLVDR